MTKIVSATIVAIIILPSALSFSPLSQTVGVGVTRNGSQSIQRYARSSNDSSGPLVDQIQPLTSPFLSLTTKDDWKEWQYSFGRNGLTDFLPQFTSELSCLTIDVTDGHHDPSHIISDAIKEDEDIDNRRVDAVGDCGIHVRNDNGDDDVSRASTSSITSTEAEQVGNFDCILDSGVLNSVINSIPTTVTWHSRNGPPALLDLVKLMTEATHAIREFGIYVAITNKSIPDSTKQYLDRMGEIVGMEWMYDLDGLSKEGYSVNVARIYETRPVNMKYVVDALTSSRADADDDTTGYTNHLLRP